MIRGKARPCPFGLPIPDGCNCVGNSIKFMAVVPDDEDEAEEVKEYNRSLLFNQISGASEQCPYADLILDKKDSVDCKYDKENGVQPAGNLGLNGSPLYPHTFVGEMGKTQYSNFPEHGYRDDNISNTYQGLLSFYG